MTGTKKNPSTKKSSHTPSTQGKQATKKKTHNFSDDIATVDSSQIDPDMSHTEIDLQKQEEKVTPSHATGQKNKLAQQGTKPSSRTTSTRHAHNKKTSSSKTTKKTSHKDTSKPNVDIKSDDNMLSGIEDITAYINQKKQGNKPTISHDAEKLIAQDGTDLLTLPHIYAVVPHAKGDHKLVYLTHEASTDLLDDPRKRIKGNVYEKKGVVIYDVKLDMKEHPTLKSSGGENMDVRLIEKPEELEQQLQAIVVGKGGGENFGAPIIIAKNVGDVVPQKKDTDSPDDIQHSEEIKEPESLHSENDSPTIINDLEEDIIQPTEQSILHPTESLDTTAETQNVPLPTTLPESNEETDPQKGKIDQESDDNEDKLPIDETTTEEITDGNHHLPGINNDNDINLSDLFVVNTNQEEAGQSIDKDQIDSDSIEEKVPSITSEENSGEDSTFTRAIIEDSDIDTPSLDETVPLVDTQQEVVDHDSVAQQDSGQINFDLDTTQNTTSPDSPSPEQVMTEISSDTIDVTSPDVSPQLPEVDLSTLARENNTDASLSQPETQKETNNNPEEINGETDPDGGPKHGFFQLPEPETSFSLDESTLRAEPGDDPSMFHKPMQTHDEESVDTSRFSGGLSSYDTMTNNNETVGISFGDTQATSVDPTTDQPRDLSPQSFILPEVDTPDTADTSSTLNLDDISIEDTPSTENIASDGITPEISFPQYAPNKIQKPEVRVLGRILRGVGLVFIIAMFFLIRKVMFPPIKGLKEGTDDDGLIIKTQTGTDQIIPTPTEPDTIPTPEDTNPDQPGIQYTIQELKAKLDIQQTEARRISNIAKLLDNKDAIKFSLTALFKARNVIERIDTESTITADEIVKETTRIDFYISEAKKMVE